MASLSSGCEQVAERPRQVVERRVFCVRCPWSAPDTDDGAGALGDHLAWHGTTTADPGIDWALGHRYGPLDGRPRRGLVLTMPELERKAGPRRMAEQGQPIEVRLRALLARGPLTRGVLLRRLDDRFPRAISVSAVAAAIAGGRVHAVARKLPRGRPTTLLSLAGNTAGLAAVEWARGRAG